MFRKKPVKVSILILACILLAGVISMAYGFYHQNSLMITIGVPLTLVTSLMITVHNIITSKEPKTGNRIS